MSIALLEMLLMFMLSFLFFVHRESEENNYFIFSYLIFQNLVMDGWIRKEIAPNSPII